MTEAGLLPRVHGSALFQRGETQAIVTTTLGTSTDEQKIDGLNGESWKRFYLHYNFPPFSTGETKPMRGPGRREIGHGALAERALSRMIPPSDQFPYTIRIVSETLESNGSSSMAAVCGGTMSLMDAGVPMKAPVAGIAMGLIKEGDKYAVLSDILGDEDHLGDMDFKVCGTARGVTAIQMDIKIQGLSRQILQEALDQAREGRLHILGKMLETLPASRPELSKYAPRITTIKVKPDQIRLVIGPGGKTIKGIVDQTGVAIDVEDDGTVNVASSDPEAVKKALDIIRGLTAEPEVGAIYKGTVKRITDFGAFVEILPNTDGLVHISELAHTRVERVEDVLKEGDECEVKVLSVDREGKVRLSRARCSRSPKARRASAPPSAWRRPVRAAESVRVVPVVTTDRAVVVIEAVAIAAAPRVAASSNEQGSSRCPALGDEERGFRFGERARPRRGTCRRFRASPARDEVPGCKASARSAVCGPRRPSQRAVLARRERCAQEAPGLRRPRSPMRKNYGRVASISVLLAAHQEDHAHAPQSAHREGHSVCASLGARGLHVDQVARPKRALGIGVFVPSRARSELQSRRRDRGGRRLSSRRPISAPRAGWISSSSICRPLRRRPSRARSASS